jgi:hypothetical protein
MPRPPRDRVDVAKVERLLAAYGPIRLPRHVVDAYATRWRDTFAAPVKRSTGQETHAGFDWHAFSEGFAPACSADDARSEYRRRQRAQEFFVLVGPAPHDGFSCRSDTLPWIEGKGLDIYVVAQDFSWTMVFTHEGYIGPYFAASTLGSSEVVR